jgi:hypothetical protein
MLGESLVRAAPSLREGIEATYKSKSFFFS